MSIDELKAKMIAEGAKASIVKDNQCLSCPQCGDKFGYKLEGSFNKDIMPSLLQCGHIICQRDA